MCISEAVQRHLIRNVLSRSVSRQENSDVYWILFLIKCIISVQVMFPCEILVPKRSDEFCCQWVVWLVLWRKHELFRAWAQNAFTFYNRKNSVGYMCQLRACRLQISVCQLVFHQRQGGHRLLDLEFAHLLSFTDVAAKVAGHLFHGLLRYQTKSACRWSLNALCWTAIFIVGQFWNRYSVVALDVGVRPCDNCQ